VPSPDSEVVGESESPYDGQARTIRLQRHAVVHDQTSHRERLAIVGKLNGANEAGIVQNGDVAGTGHALHLLPWLALKKRRPIRRQFPFASGTLLMDLNRGRVRGSRNCNPGVRRSTSPNDRQTQEQAVAESSHACCLVGNLSIQNVQRQCAFVT